MKKLILLSVALFGFTFSNLSAQSTEKTEKSTVKAEQTQCTKGNFVDKDKNGICDNHETKMKTGKGVNFVDKNGDGVCDNRGNKANVNCKGQGKGQGNCCGNQHRHRNGQRNNNVKNQ